MKILGVLTKRFTESLSRDPEAVFLRNLASAENAKAFADVVSSHGKTPFSVQTAAKLLELDQTLALTGTHDAVLSRTALHNLLNKTDGWSLVYGDHGPEARAEAIAPRMFSLYAQLYEHAQGGALARRIKNDAQYWSTKDPGLQGFVSEAARVFIQNDTTVSAQWSPEQTGAFGEILGTSLMHAPPVAIAQYAAMHMQRQGNLDFGYALLRRMEPDLRNMPAAIGIFDGMVQAVRSGVPPVLNEHDLVDGQTVIDIVTSPNPYLALGRHIYTHEFHPKAYFNKIAHPEAAGAMRLLPDVTKYSSMLAGLMEGADLALDKCETSEQFVALGQRVALLVGNATLYDRETKSIVSNPTRGDHSYYEDDPERTALIIDAFGARSLEIRPFDGPPNAMHTIVRDLVQTCRDQGLLPSAKTDGPKSALRM